MTFVSIPNGLRVVHVGHIGTQQVLNTLGAENKGGPLDSNLADIAKRHGDAWRANILPRLTSNYVHDATLCYSLEDASKAAGDAGYSTTVSGGITTDPVLPPSVTMVATFKTAKRGRTFVGRTFISGIGQFNMNADGLSWKGSVLPNWLAAMVAYKNAVDPTATNNGRLAVCSRGSQVHGTGPHVEPVTGILMRGYIGTQRRRVN